jgi:hypothetical protein
MRTYVSRPRQPSPPPLPPQQCGRALRGGHDRCHPQHLQTARAHGRGAKPATGGGTAELVLIQVTRFVRGSLVVDRHATTSSSRGARPPALLCWTSPRRRPPFSSGTTGTAPQPTALTWGTASHTPCVGPGRGPAAAPRSPPCISVLILPDLSTTSDSTGRGSSSIGPV